MRIFLWRKTRAWGVFRFDASGAGILTMGSSWFSGGTDIFQGEDTAGSDTKGRFRLSCLTGLVVCWAVCQAELQGSKEASKVVSIGLELTFKTNSKILVQSKLRQLCYSVYAVLWIVRCFFTIVSFPICLLSCKMKPHFNLNIIIQYY